MKCKSKGRKKIRTLFVIVMSFILVVILTNIVAFAVLSTKTKHLEDDYLTVIKNEKYRDNVYVEGIDIITQDVSCGYAVIEMFSSWNGGDTTEESMYDEYGKVVTSTGNSFCTEFNKQNPQFHITMYKYLTNSELIDKVYDCLSEGIPVPFEWAAKYEDEWTLHYSLVIGMDISNDKVTVANPYGYIEELTLSEFLSRTSFAAFENMPLFYKYAFAFGIFEKNTIFIPVRV